MLKIGDTLVGRYKIIALVGKGGMSKVWLAMDTTLNKQWAVKEIDKSTEEYKRTVNEDKTITEVEIMKRLDHPALPRIVNIIDRPSSLCVVMDYVEGDTLLTILNRVHKIDQDTVVSWMVQICDALEYLHEQNPPIIYRDMKPSNVMLTPSGNIKVIDFGIAREYKSGRDDTVPLGTRGYASPEHFTKHTDARSDVYTVGATMYQLLTGKDPAAPPYEMVPIRQIDPTLSSGLEKIILKATQNNPDKRYQTMKEMANALLSYKKLEQGYLDQLKRKINRFKLLAICSIAFMVAGAGCVVGNMLIDNNTYNALLSTTTVSHEQRIKNLKKAISLKPEKAAPYQALIEAYSDDNKFTEQESADFGQIYSQHKDEIERDKNNFVNVNYEIGVSYLRYYTGTTDNSYRARLMAAAPYFRNALNKKFKYYTMAKCYTFMADYYNSYILGNTNSSSDLLGGSANTGQVTVKSLNKLIDNCNSLIKTIDSYDEDDTGKIKLVTYDVMLDMIEAERNNMAKLEISQTDVEEVITKIETETDKIKTLDTDIKSQKEKVLSSCSELKSNLQMSYDKQAKQTEEQQE